MSETVLSPAMRSSAPPRPLGHVVVRGAAILMTIVALGAIVLQALHTFGVIEPGFASWRQVAILVVIWFVVVDVAVFIVGGQQGQKLLFLLPALQITLSLVIFPTIFGFIVAFTEWDLGGISGPVFNGLENFRRMATDDFFWNALANNFKYVLVAIPFQFVVAFGIALLLNQNIRGRKFFRVAFLLPFMISPVAVGWMIGRSILDANRGVVPKLLERVGLENVSFFDQKVPAFLGIVAMDSWIAIPFMMVLLLAGLQALPTEVFEAAQIDGASGWKRFWDITFPLMLPVSLTAIVLRVIFEFKLVDVVRVVTAGGPGGATDTLSLYIYREGVESTNVGYATAMAMVFLVIVLVSVTALLLFAGRRVRDVVY
ncbi:MAG: sugar ABC transporter permease [Thermomicrobiales bacterium]